MLRKRSLIIFITILTLSMVSIVFAYFYLESKESQKYTTEIDDFDQVDNNRKPISKDIDDNDLEPSIEEKEYFISANIVWWDQSAGYQVLIDNPKLFNSVSPFWYSFNEDGSLNKTSYAENQTLIDYCKTSNILFLPTFTNGLTTKVSRAIFNNELSYNTAIDNIILKVQSLNYDGIQLDFENMEAQDKEDFVSFVTDLSTRLKTIDKILITTLSAKTNETGTSKANASQDWVALGKVSDYVNIMAYDYHWSTSSPGEIAPLSWIREILDYGTNVIDREKILLGVPFYGYDWVGNKASALEHTDVLDLISQKNIEPEMTLEKEKYFTYDENGISHTVYFNDSETLVERIETVRIYKIAGIAIWRLGHEDPNSFKEIAKALK